MGKQKDLTELLKELGITTQVELDRAYGKTVGNLDLGIMTSPISSSIEIENAEIKDAV